MNGPILLRDAIILSAIVNPSGFSYNIYSVFFPTKKNQYNAFKGILETNFLCLLAILTCTAVVNGKIVATSYDITLLLAGICLGGAIVGLLAEYGIGYILAWTMHGRTPKEVRLHKDWAKHVSGRIVAITIGVAVLEELLFRVVLFNIMFHTWQMHGFVVVITSALLYGYNHAYYGMTGFITKVSSGALYALMYWWSDWNIVVPVCAHIFQNILLFSLTKRSYADRK